MHIKFQSPRHGRGETRRCCPTRRRWDYFNPLAPGGARRLRSCCCLIWRRFQSTRPGWGETAACGSKGERSHDFNPLAPGRGETLQRRKIGHFFRQFQSTRPGWGETSRSADTVAIYNISIHSPRVGRDRCTYNRINALFDFNPLAPGGARRFVC